MCSYYSINGAMQKCNSTLAAVNMVGGKSFGLSLFIFDTRLLKTDKLREFDGRAPNSPWVNKNIGSKVLVLRFYITLAPSNLSS